MNKWIKFEISKPDSAHLYFQLDYKKQTWVIFSSKYNREICENLFENVNCSPFWYTIEVEMHTTW